MSRLSLSSVLFRRCAGALPALRRPAWLLPGRVRVLIVSSVVAVASAVGVVSCAGPDDASDEESVDPWAVAASLDAGRATASASVQASRDAVLGPELVAQRETALAMEAPAWPVEAEQNDATGAQWAAIYFISLYPYVYATGDLTEWKEMSESSCGFCQNVIDKVTLLHENGGWRDPWQQDVTGTQYWDPNPGYEYSRVDVTLDSGAITSHSGDNSQFLTSEPVEGSILTLAMCYVNGRWMVGAGEAR